MGPFLLRKAYRLVASPTGRQFMMTKPSEMALPLVSEQDLGDVGLEDSSRQLDNGVQSPVGRWKLRVCKQWLAPLRNFIGIQPHPIWSMVTSKQGH